MAELPVRCIISGGQTGADRGALDAALALGLPHGGWCPKGRRAEDGRIPAIYNLRETCSMHYPERTKRNVLDSDGTLIVGRGVLRGGSALTARLATKHRKPWIYINVNRINPRPSQIVRNWIRLQSIGVLNVAGSQESRRPGIGVDVKDLLLDVLWGYSLPCDGIPVIS